MKLIKQANGKTTVKMSKNEWIDMGKKAGWMDDLPGSDEDFNRDFGGGFDKDNAPEIKEEVIGYVIERGGKPWDERFVQHGVDTWGDPMLGPIGTAKRFRTEDEAKANFNHDFRNDVMPITEKDLIS